MRVYSVVASDITISSAADVIELAWPSTMAGYLLSVEFGQRTDYGDTLSEGFRLQVVRATTSGTTPGSTPTPAKHSPGDAVASVVVEVQNSTAAAGTITVLRDIVFNVQAGWLYQPPDNQLVEVAPSGILVLRLQTALTSAVTGSLTVTFAEIG
jgi:hypothetical protein